MAGRMETSSKGPEQGELKAAKSPDHQGCSQRGDQGKKSVCGAGSGMGGQPSSDSVGQPLHKSITKIKAMKLRSDNETWVIWGLVEGRSGTGVHRAGCCTHPFHLLYLLRDASSGHGVMA